MAIEIRELVPDDIEQVVALCASDDAAPASADELRRHLRRWPGLSLVAHEGDEIVGVILCGGGDGRDRIHRLTVAESHQDGDVPRRLVDKALHKLGAAGLHTTQVAVADSAADTRSFWHDVRWRQDTDVGPPDRPHLDDPFE